MKVRATQKGFDGLSIRDKGDIFDIQDTQFSRNWMEKVDVSIQPEKQVEAPEKIEEEEETTIFGQKRKPGRPKLNKDVI